MLSSLWNEKVELTMRGDSEPSQGSKDEEIRLKDNEKEGVRREQGTVVRAAKRRRVGEGGEEGRRREKGFTRLPSPRLLLLPLSVLFLPSMSQFVNW